MTPDENLMRLRVTPALIDNLRTAFPLNDFTSVSSMEELARLQGRQEVVNYLESLVQIPDDGQLALVLES